MAYKLFEFKCTACGEEQEQMISNTEMKPEDPCKKCEAPAEKLEPQMSAGAHGRHVSWSRWAV